jgi:hypothetical protein
MPAGRTLISDSSSSNHFSNASGHSDSDPFFNLGMVPGPPEKEEVDAPPSSASEEEDRVVEVGGNRVVEHDDGPPSPNMGGEFCSVEEREALHAFSAASLAGSGSGLPLHLIRQGAMASTRGEDLVVWRIGLPAWKRRSTASKDSSLLYARGYALGVRRWHLNSGGGSASLAVTLLLTRIKAEAVFSVRVGDPQFSRIVALV